MKNIIFIPARFGSKRLKGKNMRPIKKKPLIYYTLKTAKDIKAKVKETEIIISSDDSKIIRYSNRYLKQQSIYLRPKSVSKSSSSMEETLLNLIKNLKTKKINPKNILILQPTSPIRDCNNILKFFKMLDLSKKISSIVSISKPIETPLDFIYKNNKNLFSSIKSLKKNKRFFVINGNFYIIKTKYLMKKKKIFDFTKQTKFVEIDKSNSLDINDIFDFKFCEKLMA